MSHWFSLTEQMILQNNNEKTAELATAVGEYLRNAFNIQSLTLTVDGVEYTTKKNKVWKSTRLYMVCGRLAEAKSIEYRLFTDGMEFGRPERGYDLVEAKDDPELRPNLVYRALVLTDVHDEHRPYLTLYDEKGLREPDYVEYPSGGTDVKTWCAGTVLLWVTSKSRKKDLALRDRIGEAYRRFDAVAGVDRCTCFHDEWAENGQFMYETSVDFKDADIPEILRILQELIDLTAPLDDNGFAMEFEPYSGGEDDYPFAALRFEEENGRAVCRYCRF